MIPLTWPYPRRSPDPAAAPTYPLSYPELEVEPASADAAPRIELRRLLPWALVAVLLFATAVFSVLREIQHNRDLYRMSQRVAQANEQRRQSLEALRMAEARAARLQAELDARPYPARASQGHPPVEGPLN